MSIECTYSIFLTVQRQGSEKIIQSSEIMKQTPFTPDILFLITKNMTINTLLVMGLVCKQWLRDLHDTFIEKIHVQDYSRLFPLQQR